VTFPQLRILLESLAGTATCGDGLWLSRRFVTPPDASVTLDTDDRDAMRAAHQALPYGMTGPGLSQWRVVVRATGSFPGIPYPFAGVPQVEIAPGLLGRVIAVDAGAAYWIDHHGTLIHAQPREALLQAYCSRPLSGGFWAVRLLRHAMTAQLRGDGTAVWIRAAACVVDDTEVLIAGPAGSGKTTVLLTCLRLLGAHFVADDRVLLRRDPHRLIGYPWPTRLCVPDGTFSAYPEVRERLAAPDQRPGLGHEVTVEPDEIPLLLTRGSVTDHLRPRLMLWPALSLGAQVAPQPLRVEPDEMRGVLGGTALFTHDRTAEPADPRFSGTPRLVSGALRDVANLLAATVTCYRVAVTRDPRALAAQITDLLLRLRYRIP
jgi:hypothetical protein